MAGALGLCHSAHVPRYDPLDIGVPFKASRSDLVAFEWRIDGIVADFLLPGEDARRLRVAFDSPCIVRILDELPLSTEDDDTPNEGLAPDHFAYRLTGARFARLQSQAWKDVFGPVAHYQFVTGDTCLDVLSGGAPSFSVVRRTDAGGPPAPA